MPFVDRESKYPNRYLVTDEFGNQYYLTLTRADEPVRVGTPLNAATFNAFFEAVLQGAAVVNLLDNADFRHPVNQRKVNTFSGGYGIDRWRASSNMTARLESDDYGEYLVLTCSASASVRNSITQYIEETRVPGVGTPVTVAYQDEDGNIYVESTAMPGTGSVRLFSGTGVGVTLYSATEGARLSIMVPPGESVSLRRVALYEGEYTSDTLPLFREEKPSATLMECMRYAQIHSTGDIDPRDLCPPMISTPTIIEISGGYLYSAEP